ncbi:hypothetical protein C0J52_14250 [Blattella germanica]|nr:hypothetical protein C0J52_14250 [Blattella germanica]
MLFSFSGDSLKYDPTFKGPLSKRSCTDVICFLLFFAFIGGWVAVGIYVDSNGRRCGLDEGVTDKPYLFFFDLSKCATATIASQPSQYKFKDESRDTRV